MRPVAFAEALIRQPRHTLRLGRARLQVLLYNLGFRLGGILAGNRFPPARLVELVTGSRVLAFYHLGGMLMSKSIVGILQRNGTPMKSVKTVLDFGCGCGRLIRWLATWQGDTDYWGCDYNPDLVGWCQTHLSHLARFEVNEATPPLPFEDDSFDFVYSYSVFTHLSSDRQRPWMVELARVLRPGGHLLITVHGRRIAWRDGLSAESMSRLEKEGVLVFKDDRSGTNDCVAFHSLRWMRDQRSIGLELIDHLEGGANDGSEQDVCLYRAVDTRREGAAS